MSFWSMSAPPSKRQASATPFIQSLECDRKSVRDSDRAWLQSRVTACARTANNGTCRAKRSPILSILARLRLASTQEPPFFDLDAHRKNRAKRAGSVGATVMSSAFPGAEPGS